MKRLAIPAAILVFCMTFLFTKSLQSATQELVRLKRTYSGRFYSLAHPRQYSLVYVDRDFIFDDLPSCLKKGIQIVTANDDKFSTGDIFLPFHVTRDVNVYVGYDSRYTTKPAWLANHFRQTNLTLTMTSRPEVTFNLYRRSYRRGRIMLGGNISPRERANNAMYTVIVVEANIDKCPTIIP